MRDGFGPDSVESSGLEAVLRCLKTFYIGPVLVFLVLLILSTSLKPGGRAGEGLKAERK